MPFQSKSKWVANDCICTVGGCCFVCLDKFGCNYKGVNTVCNCDDIFSKKGIQTPIPKLLKLLIF